MKLLLFILLTSFLAHAESRTWTSRTGSTIEASLEKQEDGKVTLKLTTGKTLTLGLGEFSKADQGYLKEQLIASYGSEIDGIDAVPGKISSVIKCKGSEWSYHAYLPKSFHTGQKWPVWFIMSAGGGKNGKPIQRYIDGAERLGCIVITSVESKNGFDKAQAAVEAMAKDVYKRFPVQDDFAFASGMSGGSRMSYLLAECNSNLVGVLACGSGKQVYPDEGNARDSKLRSNTYIYSLIGSNCFNRTGAYKSHTSFPDHFRLRYFPGKHAWASSNLVEQGMMRTMGQAILEDANLASFKPDYLHALHKMIEELKEEEPWESHYLASFGAELDKGYDDGYFAKTVAALESNPQVKLALAAEKDIMQLCKKFYLDYNYFNGDTEPLPERAKEGLTLSEKYSTAPHGEILKLLGEPSPGPKKR